jgi:hypothetical protein
MVFLPSKEAGELGSVPDSIPICDFVLNEKYGRVAHDSSRDPFTCGLTGKSYSSREVVDRVDHLARGLSKELGWAPNQGSEWDKTLAVFTLNTVGKLQISCWTTKESLHLFWSDRLPTPILGCSQIRWCPLSCQCILFCCRVDTSTPRFQGESPSHLCSSPVHLA